MSYKAVNHYTQLDVDRLDGGLNVKDSPSGLRTEESPDCYNVTFGDRGSAETRQGTSYFNSATSDGTTVFGSATIDGLASYNQTMVAWAGGSMYRMSSTTGVLVTTSSGKFTAGEKIAFATYQNILFMSDGSNGPYRWEGGESFYEMGITAPSAPSAHSNAAGNIAADTYYYRVAFVNSHVVEGEIGAVSNSVTIAASSTINLSDVPVGTGLQGVSQRWIYRSTATAAGGFEYIGLINDNTTTTFADTVSVGSEGKTAILDGTSPTPFTTITLHRERLWFDDSSNRTLGRYTEFSNPFISEALSFEPLNKGDGSEIIAVGVQDNLVTYFKDNSIWLCDTSSDPSDDTTFVWLKSPANVGITGPRAFTEWDNALVFAAKRDGRFVSFQLLSGITTLDTSDNFLRTRSISEKLEEIILAYPDGLWDDISMVNFDNRIVIGVPDSSNSTRIDGALWFDVTRLKSDGQPGSWARWNGDIGSNQFCVHDGVLYGASSNTDGYILRFENGTYTDASGAAIDSYWWSKEFGGEKPMESWVKDFRFVYPWYEKLGSYDMSMVIRVDGDTGSGAGYDIDLTPGGSLWGTFVWGVDPWGGATADEQIRVSISPLLGRRIQVGFNNKNTAGQGFRVHRFKVLMNLRGQKR